MKYLALYLLLVLVTMAFGSTAHRDRHGHDHGRNHDREQGRNHDRDHGHGHDNNHHGHNHAWARAKALEIGQHLEKCGGEDKVKASCRDQCENVFKVSGCIKAAIANATATEQVQDIPAIADGCGEQFELRPEEMRPMIKMCDRCLHGLDCVHDDEDEREDH